MKNKVVLILVILIVVILLGVILGIYLLNKDIKINETQNDLIENEKDDVGKVEENKEQISNEITILKVLDDIEKNSNFDRILKTTTGDISAEKLSKDEFVNSKEKYVTKLLNSMSLFNIYEENGNQYVEYETEKVLNALGYGTHMGNGIKHGLQVVNLSGNNITSTRGAISKVLNDIEENSDFDRILKTTTGDISAEKVSGLEFHSMNVEYVNKLINNKELFNIYEENGNQYVEYETEKVLNALGYGTHMGNGIKLGVQKVQL